MSKNKNKLRRTLALTASVAIMGTSIPFNVLAEGLKDYNNQEISINSLSATRSQYIHKWKRYAVDKKEKINFKVFDQYDHDEIESYREYYKNKFGEVNTNYDELVIGGSVDIENAFEGASYTNLGYFNSLEDLKNENLSYATSSYDLRQKNSFWAQIGDWHDYSHGFGFYLMGVDSRPMSEQLEENLIFHKIEPSDYDKRGGDIIGMAVGEKTTIDVKGSYIGTVTSDNEFSYPNSGKQGGYWYEYIGSEKISTDADDYNYDNTPIITDKKPTDDKIKDVLDLPSGASTETREIPNRREYAPELKKLQVKRNDKVDLTSAIVNKPQDIIAKEVEGVDTEKSGEKTGKISTTIPQEEKEIKVKITFKDNSTKEVKIPLIYTARTANYNVVVEVTDLDSDKFNPLVETLEVFKNEDIILEKYKSAIKNLSDSNASKVEIKTPADTSEIGEKKAVVEVTFPDGSTKEVEIPVKVVEKAGIVTPVPEINKDDIEKEVVPWGKDVDLTDNIKNLPEGATVEDVTDPA
ncbi:Rib/alpha-like domain-containing protein, partial [Peptoniphilus harei]